jgi:hypothetical protein
MTASGRGLNRLRPPIAAPLTLLLFVVIASGLILSPTLAHAEKGVLVVVLAYASDSPAGGVHIGTRGDGGEAMSDHNGKARIRLAPQTRVGQSVTLWLLPSPSSLVLLAPYLGKTSVPSFENESDNYVSALVVTRGDRQMLENAAVLAAGAAIANRSRPRPGPGSPSPPARKSEVPPQIFRVAYRTEQATLRRNIWPSGQAPPPTSLGLINEEAARELGFTIDEVEAAMSRFSTDPLAWKIAMLVAQLEVGQQEPFSTVRVSRTDHPDLSFGIGGFELANGTLQLLLRKMRDRDSKLFDEIMGDGAPLIDQILQSPTSSAAALAVATMGAESSSTLREPWRARFRKLGGAPQFQRVQFEELAPRMRRARQDMTGLGLRSERALAFIYDLVLNTGQTRTAEAKTQFTAFEQIYGRAPDEQERLLIIANVAPSLKAFPNLVRPVRQRRLAFALGQGVVRGMQIDLAAAGLELRDLETGAPLALAGDQGIVERLVSGWLPSLPPH